MKKPTLAVLFGGCSPEYSVSLQSSYAVLSNLNPDRYTVLPVGITQSGQWFHYTGAYDRIATPGRRTRDASPLWWSPRTARSTGSWPSPPPGTR